MKLTGVAYANTSSGETIGYENEGLAVWKIEELNKENVWFDYREGNIVVKNPDEEF